MGYNSEELIPVIKESNSNFIEKSYGDSSQFLENKVSENYIRGDIMLGIIDRFEGNFAVVEMEDGDIENISVDKIPKNAKQGYALNIDGCITINYEETEKKQNNIEKLTKNIWK